MTYIYEPESWYISYPIIVPSNNFSINNIRLSDSDLNDTDKVPRIRIIDPLVYFDPLAYFKGRKCLYYKLSQGFTVRVLFNTSNINSYEPFRIKGVFCLGWDIILSRPVLLPIDSLTKGFLPNSLPLSDLDMGRVYITEIGTSIVSIGLCSWLEYISLERQNVYRFKIITRNKGFFHSSKFFWADLITLKEEGPSIVFQTDDYVDINETIKSFKTEIPQSFRDKILKDSLSKESLKIPPYFEIIISSEDIIIARINSYSL